MRPRESNDISEDVSEFEKYAELGEVIAEEFKKAADEVHASPSSELDHISIPNKVADEFEAAKQSHEEEMKELVGLDNAKFRPINDVITKYIPSVLIPKSGNMVFEGNIHDIMGAIANTLQSGEFKITVSWETI